VVEAPVLTARATLGAGYSYRRVYGAETYLAHDRLDVLEIVADHFMDATRRRELETLADHFPLLPHGLDLSLGSADGLDRRYLDRIARVVRQARAPWWSEHVAFTRAGGVRIGHLAPLPYTEEALRVVVRNVERALDAVGVPLILENIASPLLLPGGEMEEAQFLSEIVARTGCGLLLDVANLHASALNHGYDVDAYLQALPAHSVMQLHVAGGEWIDGTYVDSHARTTSDAVWALAARACERFPIRAIIVERDERLPQFDALLGEVERARRIGAEAGLWA
jgi:uncharacterized protein (UPF0276 family)